MILNATAMSALAMVLADCLPIDPFIHPMPPVLSGTPWLAIHVPIIMVSYSVLTLGVVVAHMQVGLTIVGKGRTPQCLGMNDLLYWYMMVGSILLIAGILTGSIWAASSWGRYWGWDPKEVWSLVAFLAYMAILHAERDLRGQTNNIRCGLLVVRFQNLGLLPCRSKRCLQLRYLVLKWRRIDLKQHFAQLHGHVRLYRNGNHLAGHIRRHFDHAAGDRHLA